METRDILFVVLSVGILALVIFFCIVLYQLFKVLKNVEVMTENMAHVSKDASHTSHLVTQGVDLVSNKLSKTSELLAKFGPIIQEAVATWSKKRKSKKSK